jgi:hypothetical protein
MLDFIQSCANAVACNFDKTPTLAIAIFELFVLVGVAATFLILPKFQPQIGLRFLLVSIGVLIFELFTAPMWHNYKMGWWAYVYRDVSWILTIGWSALILSTVVLVDQVFSKLKEWQRFGLYLLILTGLVSVLEMVVVNIGIRSYAPEVLNAVSGVFIWNVPIELLYYTPVFTSLVIAFYKYWSFAITHTLLIPVKHQRWLRDLLLAFLSVFLFEVMIEPMVQNRGLPQWSYIFHDISLIMTGIWVITVWFATDVVNKFLIHYNATARFLITLLTTAAIALPLEAWYILQGYRVYGPSAVANFTGFTTPIAHIPVEVAFAIPCYMALVIGFIRYWEIVWDNEL